MEWSVTAALEYMAFIELGLPPSVIIQWRFESQFWNDEVRRTIKEVEEDYRISFNLVKVDTPKTNKYDRILTLQPYYQNGRLYYNDKKQSHNDTATGLQQLYGIEPGYKTHDDAPDADEQCIKYLSRHLRKCKTSGARTGRMKKNQKRRL